MLTVSKNSHQELVNKIIRAGDAAVRVLATRPKEASLPFSEMEHLQKLQEVYQREFPVVEDKVEFWETLWLRTDRVREQWNRIEKMARRADSRVLDRLQPVLDERRRSLYEWARQFISEHSSVSADAAHFELGISTLRPDYRGLHERLEGLYESIKRIGRLPTVKEGLELPEDRTNFGMIYGGGWNVSTFSVLREAAHFPEMNAFVAFDHPGPDLFSRRAKYKVRLATAGLVRSPDEDNEEYLLTTFRQPMVLHFVCPYEWAGTPPHELSLPILRSDLILEIVDDKLTTSRALAWYSQSSGIKLPLLRERGIQQALTQVEFVYDHIKGVSTHLCLKRKAKSHVVIDQVEPLYGGIGKNGMEAIALDCVTISSWTSFRPNDFYPPHPVLIAENSRHVRDHIVKLVKDKELYRKFQRKTQRWKKYIGYKNTVNYIASVIGDQFKW